MVIGVLVALLATLLVPILGQLFDSPRQPVASLPAAILAMPLGWWIQLGALFALALLCLGILASGRVASGLLAVLDWVGLALGFVALGGFALTGHAASTLERGALGIAIAHQWSSALWTSGLFFLVGGWRGLGSDVARFRTVRWIGGVLVGISAATGLIAAWQLLPPLMPILADRYGRLLLGKGVIVLLVLAMGLATMVVPRRSNALRASRSLGLQSGLATLVVLFSAILALLVAPGTTTEASLVGVDLADVVPLDPGTFAAPTGAIHLLVQPTNGGGQTVVVRVVDAAGRPLAPAPIPQVAVTWMPLTTSGEETRDPVTVTLRPDDSGALFSGATTLPADGWWQVDVVVTPPGGIATRARFWLVLPDPNIAGHGPRSATDVKAEALFRQGLQTLTSLRSVRYTQRLGDGGGTLFRSRTAVSAADGERPAAYTETVLDTEDQAETQQIIIGDRRWLQAPGEAWVAAPLLQFTTPGAWGEAYVDTTGFQLGPKEEVDGESARSSPLATSPPGAVARGGLVCLVDRAGQRRGAARSDGLRPALHGLRLQRLRRLAGDRAADRGSGARSDADPAGRHACPAGIDADAESMIIRSLSRMIRSHPNAATTFDLASTHHEKAAPVMRTSSSTVLNLPDASWSALESTFQITDGDTVREFLAAHLSLVDLLFEVREEIRRYFGESPMKLEIFRDPESEEAELELFVIIQTHLDAHDALERLHQFDREWWLAMLKKTDAPVVVTVHLV